MRWFGVFFCASILGACSGVLAEEKIQLASDPALSPDGKTLLLTYRNDIWSVPTSGGIARRLTTDPANDLEAEFSPDGKSIAFISERTGSRQVFQAPAEGGTPQQLTHHTAGFSLHGWAPDGTQLLVSGSRDYFWRKPERMFWIPREGRTAEIPLFDDYGNDPSISPDGKNILFTREGEVWWRKGYTGSQASQIWMFNTEHQSFTRLLDPAGGARWPLWKPDGKSFFYVSGESGVLNLHSYEIESRRDEAITHYQDDAVVFPTLSADGSTLVFRKLFDLYRYEVGSSKSPEKIALACSPDLELSPELRRTFTSASGMATTRDGLEIAFLAGGDVWAMDTELREPVQITSTAEEERDIVFTPNGDAVWFISDAGGQTDIWKAERADRSQYWWQNGQFTLTRITNDDSIESHIRFSPDGSHVAFTRSDDLWVADASGQHQRVFQKLRFAPRFDWSPDGKWICYSTIDDNYNSDIWVASLDGAIAPYNLSRSPGNDGEPRWSPDGKMIAFTGLREVREVDLYIIHLLAPDFEMNSRDRKRDAAIEKLSKARSPDRTATKDVRNNEKPTAIVSVDAKPAEAKAAPVTVIQFEGIHDRTRRISIPNSREGSLFWSPDSKKIAFSSTVDGKRGTYTVEFPENFTPTLLSTSQGTSATWLSEGNQIMWLVSGVPTSMVPGGRNSTYSFSAHQEEMRTERMRAAFEMCWRAIRDGFYDARLGNKNWDEIRRKYADAAVQAVDDRHLATVVCLMLGELNASHMGFTPSADATAGEEALIDSFDDSTIDPLSLWDLRGEPDPEPDPALPRPPASWSPVTAHLGLRFDSRHKGPGLKVRDVIPGGPTSQQVSRVQPGEIVISIDGTVVDPAFDLTQVLNGRADREIRLVIRSENEGERTVNVRPASYATILPKLYDMWVEETRQKVDELSHGTLGYLHIRAMNPSSFNKFMEDLAFAGEGKEGLIIDVRENGGGSIADHLLTSLTQPVHAYTLSRAGGIGYPHDRTIYPTWHKPIIVLCNQNSFSNAEIFSHAVKTLKRGKLLGVPTAGGVITTQSARIMDVGNLRMPTRGWYVLESGEDMELNGAIPDVILWPEPGQMPAGEDVQLVKAIEVLDADVKAWQERPRPTLIKASERGRSSAVTTHQGPAK